MSLIETFSRNLIFQKYCQILYKEISWVGIELVPGGDAPAVLEHILLLPRLGILERDVEHLAKVLAEVVWGGALDGPPGGGDVGLHRGGVVAAGKLLLLSLAAPDDGDGQQLLVDPPVQVQDLQHLHTTQRQRC